jgi:hypothetical protein
VERERRLKYLLREEAKCGVENVYWLSFVDPDAPEERQFLGVCMVQAFGLVTAIEKARSLGFNPGGEVAGCEATPEQTAVIINRMPDALNRLYPTRSDAESLDARLGALLAD